MLPSNQLSAGCPVRLSLSDRLRPRNRDVGSQATHSGHPGRRLLIVWLVLLLAVAAPPWDTALAGNADSDAELMDLSLEELISIKVTSASKKPQRLDDVAAAIYVLSSEDLRRSGVTSIPEALRTVPGLHVARIDANKWAISARGFNDRFANKMLVLVDGRSVYTHLFSGVFWETLDIPLDDIERIEVIRGPGATVWGANAVNGVVNVITRSTNDTEGKFLSVGAGTEERTYVSARYGAKLNESTQFHVHGSFGQVDDGYNPTKRDISDDWQTGRVGFRLDWKGNARHEISLIGDLFRTEVSSVTKYPTISPPYARAVKSRDPFTGQSLHAKWRRKYAGSGALDLQAYWDHQRFEVESMLSHEYHAIDFEAVNRLPVGSIQEIVAGLEYRTIHDQVDSSAVASLTPSVKTSNQLSAFVQHELTMLDHRLITTVGSKFEHHQLTGWEVQPNFRILARPWQRHTIWAAASRAVRTPARVDESLSYLASVVPPDPSQPGAPTTLAIVKGSSEVRSEELLAIDIGYRLQATEAIAFDLAGYHYEYDNLRTNRAGTPTFETINAVPYIRVPIEVINGLTGESFGAELAFDYHVHPNWNLSGAYSYLNLNLSPMLPDVNLLDDAYEGMDPAHQYSLRTSLDPTQRLELDFGVRYVDAIPAHDIDSYFVGDVRAAWRWSEGLSTSISARNLFESHHREFVQGYVSTFPTEVQTGIFGKVEWSF